MTTYTIDHIAHANAGIAREWALCRHYHITRTAHDHASMPLNKEMYRSLICALLVCIFNCFLKSVEGRCNVSLGH